MFHDYDNLHDRRDGWISYFGLLHAKWDFVFDYIIPFLLSVCFSLSRVPLSVTPCQASLSYTISWSLLKLMSIESVMPSNHLMLGFPLLLLPSVFPSIRVSSNELALPIRWPKYWSFSFLISPSLEGLMRKLKLQYFTHTFLHGVYKSIYTYVKEH